MFALDHLRMQELKQHALANTLVHALKSSGALSLVALAEQEGVSVSEVSFCCQWLAEIAGLTIVNNGRTCELLNIPMSLKQDEVIRKLLAKATPVEGFYVIDSTSGYLRRWADTQILGSSQERLSYAHFQTAGRGQWGRGWIAPLGHSMLCSMLWLADSDQFCNVGWAQWFSLVTAEVLLELGINGIQLKWPNDLQMGGRKLGGILVERFVTRLGAYGLLVGCGLNVYDHYFLREPSLLAISLDQAEVKTAAKQTTVVSLDVLMPAVVRRWKYLLEKKETASGLCDRWKRFDAYYKKRVVGKVRGKTITGLALGVNEYGALILSNGYSEQCYVEGDFRLET